MKNKHIRLNLIVFACILTLTGCGTSLYEMTDAEEQLICHYSAYVIAKYNIKQTDGMTNAVPSEDDLIDETEALEEQIAEQISSLPSISIGEAIGQSDVTVTYTGYSVASNYEEGGYYCLTPGTGKSYAVLNFTIYNPYVEEKTIDAFMVSPQFYASFNGEDPVRADSNFLTYSLSNYQGTLGAGQSVDVVLLFAIDSDVAESISVVNMTLEKDGTTYAIDLQANN